jgi:two-component system chemotaxis response regulator CheY
MSAKRVSPLKAQPPAAVGRILNLRPRILVADDDPNMLGLTVTTLRHSGYQVDLVEDGALAWDALQANSYDLLITDHNMPMMTGLTLLKRIQAAHLDLPAILMSGDPPRSELRQNPALLIAAILLKPFTQGELSATVNQVLFATVGNAVAGASLTGWQSQSSTGDLQRS